MDKALYFEKYLNLRNELDDNCEKLYKDHHKLMQCRKGCDSCCEKFSVFPLEFDVIKTSLLADTPNLNHLPRKFEKFRKSCLFLNEGSCTIYNHRPFICRTQGFPLLYQNDDGTAYQLSVCSLNFKGFNVAKFHEGNALYMPKFNSPLFLLNQEYVKIFYPKQYLSTTRISLSSII